jgi:hypothetical protein
VLYFIDDEQLDLDRREQAPHCDTWGTRFDRDYQLLSARQVRKVQRQLPRGVRPAVMNSVSFLEQPELKPRFLKQNCYTVMRRYL